MRLCLIAATLVAFALPVSPLAQQAVPPSPAQAASAFEQEPLVLRSAKLVIEYNADGTGTRTESQAFTLQSEAAIRQFSVVGLSYESASQTAEFVYVRARLPNGEVIDTPLTDVQDQTPPVTQQAPFYSDLRQKQIPVRGLQVGDTIEWETRTTITKPEAPNQFWGAIPFARGIVAQNQTVELRLPAQAVVNVWTNPANHVAPQRSSEGAKTVYRWQWQSLTPTVGKEAEVAKTARAGKPLTAEEQQDELEGRLPDIAFTTFPDWAAVGAWYRSLEVGRTEPDATIRAKVAQITAHSTTEEDRVRAVYDWVASNVRYVGVALGVGRYQPHAASAVLANGYGDCKDKHTLLASMLLALGEHPDAVLIGAGIRFNAAVPSPASFNHLITHLRVDGKPVWLDSTSEIAAYQVLVPAIRNKQALLVPDTGTATIERTPDGFPFTPFSTVAVEARLDKDLNTDATIVYRFHDDTELALRSLLRRVSPAQYPQFVQKVMEQLGFSGVTGEPHIENLNDQEKPLTFLFKFHRAHDPEWGPDRVPVLFGRPELPTIDPRNPPAVNIRLGVPRTGESVLDLQLPDGWSAELPEAAHQQLPEVRMDTTYALDGHTLHAKRTTTVLSSSIPAADWKRYDTWFHAANAGGVPFLRLIPASGKPGSAPGATSGTAPAGPRTQAERLAEARRLVTSGSDKLQQSDLDGAEKDFLAAKALNENQEFLWGNLGVVAERRGNHAEASKDFSKEIELYPNSDFAWNDLLNLQLQQNDKAAETTVRGWVAASPAKLEPRAALVNVLWASGQNAAALKAAQDGAAALSADLRESNSYQLLLGEAEMRGGAVSSGAERLSHLIQSDATTLQANDADYELAREHQQLPVAEITQRDVLKKLEAESLAWTGDESPATMRKASVLFSAAWDTMGWILYQEGKFAEAETYIAPAWRNRPNAEIGEHLGDVQTALHQNREAARTYVLANFAAHDAMGTSPTLKQKAAAAMQKDHNLLGNVKPADALAAEQTFAIAGATDLSGTAVYDILFTREQVIHIKAAAGNTTPAQDAEIRKAKLAALFPPSEQAALFYTVSLTCNGTSCSVRLNP